MKKLIHITLVLIGFLSFTTTEGQNIKHNFSIECKSALSNPVQFHFAEKEAFKNKLIGNTNPSATSDSRSLVWKWDTIITFDTLTLLLERHIRTFDMQGNTLTYQIQNWVNNIWENNVRFSYTYDANSYILSELTEQGVNNTWENLRRSNYTYSANYYSQSMLTEIWQTNSWVNSYRITSNYDEFTQVDSRLSETWINNAWLNAERETILYDINFNRLSLLTELWINNAWFYNDRQTSTYDSLNHPLTHLNEQWQFNTWVNDFRVTYTYAPNGESYTVLDENWLNNAWVNDSRAICIINNNYFNGLPYLTEIWINNAWENFYKYTYTFDVNNNMLSLLRQAWLNNYWENTYKITFSPDASGNNLNTLQEVWQNNNWVNDDRYTYTYDANGNSLSGKYETFQNGIWKDSMGYFPNWSIYYPNSISNDFYTSIVAHRYAASYQSFNSTGISKANNITNISIYPNPVEDQLYIESASNACIEIINLNGQTIKSINTNSTLTTTDLSNIPSGLYTLKIITSNEVHFRKFIKL
jgi:hypothetical protein